MADLATVRRSGRRRCMASAAARWRCSGRRRCRLSCAAALAQVSGEILVGRVDSSLADAAPTRPDEPAPTPGDLAEPRTVLLPQPVYPRAARAARQEGPRHGVLHAGRARQGPRARGARVHRLPCSTSPCWMPSARRASRPRRSAGSPSAPPPAALPLRAALTRFPVPAGLQVRFTHRVARLRLTSRIPTASTDMKELPVNKPEVSRRRFLAQVALAVPAGAALLDAVVINTASAQAAPSPKLELTDPSAKALLYVDDASQGRSQEPAGRALHPGPELRQLLADPGQGGRRLSALRDLPRQARRQQRLVQRLGEEDLSLASATDRPAAATLFGIAGLQERRQDHADRRPRSRVRRPGLARGHRQARPPRLRHRSPRQGQLSAIAPPAPRKSSWRPARRVAHIQELAGSPEPALDELVGRMAGVDLVLVEGWKSGDHPRLELRRSAAPHRHRGQRRRACWPSSATRRCRASRCRCCRRDDVPAIADFILHAVGLPRRPVGAASAATRAGIEVHPAGSGRRPAR